MHARSGVSSNARFTQRRVLHARLLHDRRRRGGRWRSLGARPFLRRLAAVLPVVASLGRTRPGARGSLLSGSVGTLRPLGLLVQQGRDHFKFRQRPVNQAAEHIHKLRRLVLVAKGVNRARPLLQRVQRLAKGTVCQLLRLGSRCFAFCHFNGAYVHLSTITTQATMTSLTAVFPEQHRCRRCHICICAFHTGYP